MTSFSRYRRWFAAAALWSVLLRVLVPAGYMPAALAGGWYLSLCPHGMPNPAAVAALGNSSDHHDHHAHTQHGHALHDQAGHDQQSVGHDHTDGHAFDHCELGSGFALSAIVDAAVSLPALIPPVAARYVYLPVLHRETPRRHYDSRAPPFSLPLHS